MLHTPTRRLPIVAASAALMAALVISATAVPTLAARPKCAGKTATIVGTNRADVIIGTARRDVIVAKGGADKVFGRGGNDLICGGAGNDRLVGNAGIDKLIAGNGADRLYGGAGPDRLFGGPGPDTLAGQPGNDVLDGGLGVDTCYQGLGTGPVVRCELPAAPVTPPTPTGPSLVPIGADVLAIAYSDIDGLDGYSTGDVLISKLIDKDGSRTATAGDMVVLDKYPTSFSATEFKDWGKKSHFGIAGWAADYEWGLRLDDYNAFQWIASPVGQIETYYEGDLTTASFVSDQSDAEADNLRMSPNSPSLPAADVDARVASSTTDDDFIDVEVFYGPMAP